MNLPPKTPVSPVFNTLLVKKGPRELLDSAHGICYSVSVMNIRLSFGKET